MSWTVSYELSCELSCELNWPSTHSNSNSDQPWSRYSSSSSCSYTSNSSSSTNRYDPGMRPSGGGAAMGLTLSTSETLGFGMGGSAHSNALPIDTYDSGISQFMPALKPTQYSVGGVGRWNFGNSHDSSMMNQSHSILMSPNSSQQMGFDPRSYSSPSMQMLEVMRAIHFLLHHFVMLKLLSLWEWVLGDNARAGTLGPEDAFGSQDWKNSNPVRPPSAGNQCRGNWEKTIRGND